ncbi:hypothetical protein E5259_16385 [Blautia producta]|uniref:Uncharacterized protein n=1 Tax=Blautia producta TaxID=33035 RepID=A0A7G5N3K5_9FIRM|nr:hypothetical protein E5259_16385 [Blautia producta]
MFPGRRAGRYAVVTVQPYFVTIQPFGFIATKVCTQTAQTAVWRVAALGLPCECKAAPRGKVEG